MEALYQKDSYLKESRAIVESVKDDKFVVLDKTLFYPNSGGQPHDTGLLIKDDQEFPVVYTGTFNGVISHEVAMPGLVKGDRVKVVID